MKKLGAFISLTCMAATLFAGSAAAQKATGLQFYAEPAPGSSTTNGYYVIEAEPGDSIVQKLHLRNDSKKPLKLRLYPSDAKTSLYGGADYTGPDVEPEGVGTWIALQEDKVTLEPKQGVQVKFRVRVPEDAPSGENLGGISIFPVKETKGVAGNEAGEDEATAQIVVEYRRVIAVQVNTPGPAEPKLMISGLEPTARPDGAYLDMNIANEGTALTTGKGVIKVPGLDYERKFDVDTFVPNSQIFYPVRFDDSIPTGEHDASIRIEYDDGDKVVEWSTSFAVTDELIAELAERGAPGAAEVVTTRGNLVPYATAIAAAMFAFMVWKRFRRREEVVAPSGPAPLSATSSEPEPAIAAVAAEAAEPVAAPPPAASRAEGRTVPAGTSTGNEAKESRVVTKVAPARYVVPPVGERSSSANGSAKPRSSGRGSSSAAPSKAKTTAKRTAPRRKPTRAKAKATGTKAVVARRTAAAKTKKKTTAKRSAPKSTARKTAPVKTSAKKPAAKRTTSKKTAAKKAVRKTPAKKTTAARNAVKKTATKKTGARSSAMKGTTTKSAPRKTAARTPAPKKPTAKKTATRTAKKAVAKKTTAKAATKKAAGTKSSRKTTASKKSSAKGSARRAR